VAVLHQHLAEDAGVVHEHVEAAEGRERRPDRGAAASDRADIAGGGHDAGAKLLDRASRRFSAMAVDRDARAGGQECPHGRRADAARAAGDEHGLVAKIEPDVGHDAHHSAPVETVMSWPLMPEDSSRQRKAATAPISSGSMMLLRG